LCVLKRLALLAEKNKNSVSNLITSPGYRNVERIVAADFRVRAASPLSDTHQIKDVPRWSVTKSRITVVPPARAAFVPV